MAEGGVVPREAELADTLTSLQLTWAPALAGEETRLASLPPEPRRLLFEVPRPSLFLTSLRAMEKPRGHKSCKRVGERRLSSR